MDIQERFETWDKEEYIFNPALRALLDIPKGAKINQDVLSHLENCTICPVGNASCREYFEIQFIGIHPCKNHQEKTIRICPLGCTKETCILNK